MGMYTELYILIPINPEHINTLNKYLPYLMGDEPTTTLPNHPFFACDRASAFLTRSNGLTKPNSELFSPYKDCYYLQVGTNLKNYGDEIRLFLDWIFPMTYHDGSDEEPNLVGTYRYEEDQEYSNVYQITNGFKITPEPEIYEEE